jgi:hypothetical protein
MIYWTLLRISNKTVLFDHQKPPWMCWTVLCGMHNNQNCNMLWILTNFIGWVPSLPHVLVMPLISVECQWGLQGQGFISRLLCYWGLAGSCTLTPWWLWTLPLKCCVEQEVMCFKTCWLYLTMADQMRVSWRCGHEVPVAALEYDTYVPHDAAKYLTERDLSSLYAIWWWDWIINYNWLMYSKLMRGCADVTWMTPFKFN